MDDDDDDEPVRDFAEANALTWWTVTTPATDDRVQKSFRTHANYLRALVQLSGYDLFPTKDNAVTEKLGAAVATAFPAAVPSRTADIAELSKSLNRAWVAELVLAVSVSMFNGTSSSAPRTHGAACKRTTSDTRPRRR